MSEHISSYAKDLQTRVGFGQGEGKDNLTDKSTVTYNPSVDGMEPTYDRDYFEKDKYPTKARSWPEITPRMRYNESNQTDNFGTPAKSEYELVSKLKNYLKNLRKPKDNQNDSGRGVDKSSCRICSQKSHSDDCLIRTKTTHDFFKNKCEASSPHGIQDPPCAVNETDALSSKKMVKCKCQLPESSQEVEYDKEGIKPLVKCLCHQSKSQERVTDKEVIKPLVKCLCHHSKLQEEETDKKVMKPLVKCLCHHSKSQEGETDKKGMKPLVKCLCHHSKSQEGETDKKVMKPLVKCLCHHSKSQERENNIEVKKPLTECTCHPLEPSLEEENGKKAMKPSLSAGKLSSKSINIVASAPTMQHFVNKRFPLA